MIYKSSIGLVLFFFLTITAADLFKKTKGFVKETGKKALDVVPGFKKAPVQAVRESNGCNGFVGLCSRRYNEVAYVHAHNATTQGPSIVNNQDISLQDLLKRGVRSIKIPIHYARDMGNKQGEGPTVCHGIYRPTLYKDYYGAVQQALLKKLSAFFNQLKPAMKIVGGVSVPGLYMKVQDVPDYIKQSIEGLQPIATMVERALPLAYGNTLSPPSAQIPYTPCAIDPAARSLEQVGRDIKNFLEAHPREVMTVMLESTVPLRVVGQVLQGVGLSKYAHIQNKTEPWPTLEHMINTGKRLVIFSTAPSPFPWILSEKDFFFESAGGASSKEALQKAVSIQENNNYKERNRAPQNKLFYVGHFLTIGFGGMPRAADVVNERRFITQRIKTIGEKGKAFPNFIGTDFSERPRGDVFELVNEINGVGTYAGKPLFKTLR